MLAPNHRHINDKGMLEQLAAMFNIKSKRKKATRQTKGQWKTNDRIRNGYHIPGKRRK